jgi:hypothetical protein
VEVEGGFFARGDGVEGVVKWDLSGHVRVIARAEG